MLKNKEGQVRSGWKLVGVYGAFYFLMIIAAIGNGIIAALVAHKFNQFDMNALKFSEGAEHIIFLVTMYVQEILMISVPIFAWKVMQKQKLPGMGLSAWREGYKDLLKGLVIGFILFSLVFIVLVLTGNAKVVSEGIHFSSDTFTYLILFIMVGFGEEIMGRGYTMSVLKQTKNMPIIVIISSMIFSLIHGVNPGISVLALINIALVGLLLAYMFIKSGSIWLCIGYHIIWNYSQGNIYGFLVSGVSTQGLISTEILTPNLINGGTFGPEGGFVVTAVTLLGFLIVYYLYPGRATKFLDAPMPEEKEV